jgi:hypothetical protein
LESCLLIGFISKIKGFYITVLYRWSLLKMIKKYRLLESNGTAVCLKTQPIMVQWLQVINTSKN